VIFPGGKATGAIVDNGGVEVVQHGGTASATTVNNGGIQDDYGKAGGTIVHNGGIQDVEIGGNANGTIVDKGGLQDVFGTATKTTVSGEQDVFGSATGTTVKTGGVEVVKDGGNTRGTIVDNGGAQDVFGGTATDTTVKSGGMQLVGFLFNDEGGAGTAIGTVIKSGGIQDDGGNASGTIIKTGGKEIVESGGLANGATIDGGMLEFKTGATAGSAEITFAGKGVLTLYDSFDFTGLVAGFDKTNQELDLKDIAFVSGTTSETFTQIVPDGGLLAVSDGMHTANIQLLGNYVTQDFHLASDGHGGTLVTELPITGAVHLPHGFLL
jgi:autotransporter passenger strand-loop-strand repeat protein